MKTFDIDREKCYFELCHRVSKVFGGHGATWPIVTYKTYSFLFVDINYQTNTLFSRNMHFYLNIGWNF